MNFKSREIHLYVESRGLLLSVVIQLKLIFFSYI